MVQARMFLAAMTALTLVAPAGVANAGGGGVGLGIGQLLQCWIIQGENPPDVLTVNDQFTDATAARVGTARLLCTAADGFPCTADRPECRGINSPDLQTPDVLFDHFTCYERGLDSTFSGAVVKLTDVFGEQTVRVFKPAFLCVSSAKQCLPDPRTGETRCPVLDPPPPQ